MNIISLEMSYSMNWFLVVLPPITNQTLLLLGPLLPLLPHLFPPILPLRLLLLPLLLPPLVPHVKSLAQSRVKFTQIPFGLEMNAWQLVNSNNHILNKL